MAIAFSRRYFVKYVDDIDTVEIFRPLRAARNDAEVAEIVAAMNREGKFVLGERFNLRFDATSICRKFEQRVFLTIP